MITEAFQTPLAHVNVLSQNRGTPNMALVDAQHDSRIAALLGKLVRFDVGDSGFQVSEVSAEEAADSQAARKPTGERVAPHLDASVRGPVELAEHGREDLPSLGAKAAQLAELGPVDSTNQGCAGPLTLPATPFAIPAVHYIEHFEKSGARHAQRRSKRPRNPRRSRSARGHARAAEGGDHERARRSRAARPSLTAHPATLRRHAPALPQQQQHRRPTRLNGAGLYESWSGALGDPDRPIEDAIRAV